MKIKLEFQKAGIGWLFVALVMGAVFWWVSGFSPVLLLVFGVLYFLIQCLKVETNPKYAWMNMAALTAAGSVFSAYHVQYLLLDAELRTKITGEKMLLNILCCLTVYLAVQVFMPQTGVACIIAHAMIMLLAAINYFVYLFRGNEFIFADLRSIQTGLSVAENYQFVIEPRVGAAVLLSTLYLALMRRLSAAFRHHLIRSGVCISLAVLCVVYIGGRTKGVVTETWEQKGSYRNGYLLNFVLSVRDNFVKEPENYSISRLGELESRYGGEEENAGGAKEEREREPAVIVIMNESFADLEVVGEFFTDQPVTPFYDSLTENVTKGYALSSVFGAKTPNSEWEFLTGNSMAFLPAGSVVYQQYIDRRPDSLVSALKDQGYTCVAMHPYYETGWSRNKVYPDLGFDEMYFLDDFDNTKMLRRYVSDEELYDQIIARFEKQPAKEKLFIMSVSMQNHGGYTEKYDNFDEEVRMLINHFPDVDQYLSLLHESDKALERLIAYFSAVEEPVEIVFFGDHQPSLSSWFYPYLNGKGLSGLTLEELEHLFTVPFFIWTNYESGEETVELASLNYLSTMAMQKAGLPLTPYQKFLAGMREVVPAINARGYYSNLQRKYLHREDAIGEEADWLADYELLQYNGMFDRKRRSGVFFPRD